MSNQIKINTPDIINNQELKQHDEQKLNSVDLPVESPANDLLKVEKDEDFFNYLNWLGLAKRSGLIVLSSKHHYYYNLDDLKNITTVVNMMPLNKIDNLKQFILMISGLIPHECYFTGCFRDNNRKISIFSRKSEDINPEYIDHGILSKIPLINIINNFLDKKTNNYMDKKSVTFMLENQGFKVLDLTELNGLTYFCAKKLVTAEN
jgi:hypothetical protein